VSEAASTIELTTEVVASYLSNHHVAVSDIPALIRSIYAAFTDPPEVADGPSISAATKAQIRKSVTPAAIINFEDGRGYKMLRRHLAKYDLTPAAYRAKWGLPADYPMVAPAYSAERSVLAKARGLGRRASPPPAAAEKTRRARTAKAAAVEPAKPSAVRSPRPKTSGG
jgi:predicted transcriptional regulator